MPRLRVAVLYGGRSGEHEISLRSAESIIAGLDPRQVRSPAHLHHARRPLGAARASRPNPARNPGIDVVFPVLHGTFGEDGTVQGLLELAGSALRGSGRAGVGGRRWIRKSRSACWSSAGCPWPSMSPSPAATSDEFQPSVSAVRQAGESRLFGRHLESEELRRAGGRAGAGRPVRPQDPGRARHRRPRVRMLRAGQRAAAWRRSPARLSPRAIFTITKTSICWTRPRLIVPAPLTPEQTAEMQRLAVAAYQAVECEGMARVDFLMETATGKLYINEINTIPGFTSISMYPKMWEAAGVPFRRAPGPADRAGAGAPSRPPSHAIQAMKFLSLFAFICVCLRPLLAADDPAAQMEQRAQENRRRLRRRSRANPPIPCRPTSRFTRARFPACCARSIRIRCSSIPISSSSCSRCSRASARDSAPSSACCRAA